jgi:thymidylate synthase
MEQVDEQLSRTPLALPTMKINPDIDSIFDFTFEDFELVDYKSHAHIKAPISV